MEELIQKGQLDSSCRRSEDNIKIDIKYDVRVCELDLCSSSMIQLRRFVKMMMNFSVYKTRVSVI